MRRIHVLAPPHMVVTRDPDFQTCAHTQNLINYCKGLKQLDEYYIIQYGHENDSLEYCHEHITVINDDDFDRSGYFDIDRAKDVINIEKEHQSVISYNKNASEHISAYHQFDDIIVTFYDRMHMKAMADLCHLPVIQMNPIADIYNHHFDYMVYLSNVAYHMNMGISSAKYRYLNIIDDAFIDAGKWNLLVLNCDTGSCHEWSDSIQNLKNKLLSSLPHLDDQDPLRTPRYMDTIIPLSVDTDLFKYKPKKEKEDYMLFIGRIDRYNGIEIAVRLSEDLDKKLIVRGHGNATEELLRNSKNVEYIDRAITTKEREELINKAELLISPRILSTGFTSSVIESLASGTPVVASGWGSFPDVIQDGVNGYLCNTYEDFVKAVVNIDKIDSETCLKSSEKYHIENISLMHHLNFDRIFAHKENRTLNNELKYDIHPDFWSFDPSILQEKYNESE